MLEITATFEDGVFRPDEPPAIAEHARVRLVVQFDVENLDEHRRQDAWSVLKRIWKEVNFDSQGDRLSREQLHERR